MDRDITQYQVEESDNKDDLILYADQGITQTLHAHIFSNSVVFPQLIERKNIKKSGNDIVGIDDQELSVSYETTATMTFVESGAGYKNTVGHYEISADGSIHSAGVAFENAKQVKAGNEYEFQVSGAEDSSLGFFIIANGYNVNKSYRDVNVSEGTLEFVFDYGGAGERIAKITDSAKDVSLVHKHNGVETVLKGNIYHTTEKSGSTQINIDNKAHAIAGVTDEDNPDTLRIGFEDLKNWGDADFNDVVFDVKVASRLIESGTPDDILNGSDVDETIYAGLGNDTIRGYGGDDTLYGDVGNDFLDGGAGNDVVVGGAGNDEIQGSLGDDILVGGAGKNILFGGGGADTFIFTSESLDGQEDIIKDFNIAEGDVIDLSEALASFVPGTSHITDFVVLTTSGNTAFIRIDASGTGSFSDIAIRLDNVTAADMNNILNTQSFVISGDNTIEGSGSDDTFYGYDGDDVLYGHGGRDTLFGGIGDDVLYGGAGVNLLTGGQGADRFVFEMGSLDADMDIVRDLNFEQGDLIDISALMTSFVPGISDITDYLYFTNTATDSFLRFDVTGSGSFSLVLAKIDGINDLDVITLMNEGGVIATGDNIIEGSNSNDTFYGYDGDDVLYGEAGRDALFGGGGDDTLIGGAGVNRLTGNDGADTFKFTDDSLDGEMDVIRDFNASEGDKIDISDVLQGYDPLTDSIADFVKITHSATDSFVRVDVNGEGRFGELLTSVRDVADLDVQTMIENGSLIV